MELELISKPQIVFKGPAFQRDLASLRRYQDVRQGAILGWPIGQLSRFSPFKEECYLMLRFNR